MICLTSGTSIFSRNIFSSAGEGVLKIFVSALPKNNFIRKINMALVKKISPVLYEELVTDGSIG